MREKFRLGDISFLVISIFFRTEDWKVKRINEVRWELSIAILILLKVILLEVFLKNKFLFQKFWNWPRFLK